MDSYFKHSAGHSELGEPRCSVASGIIAKLTIDSYASKLGLGHRKATPSPPVF